MFNENEFKFNIDNIKNDLAIEGMDITQNDVDMFRMFAQDITKIVCSIFFMYNKKRLDYNEK